MRRKAAVSLVVLGIAAVPALSAARGPRHASARRITVRPTTGSPATRFVVSFRAPERTGRYGSSERRYEVTATGPTRHGCGSSGSAEVPPTRWGQRVHATLDPRASGGAWCPGTYHGRIEELMTAVCTKGEPCPAFVALLRRIGTFTFRVVPARRDKTRPTFAGPQRASACTPGPQRPDAGASPGRDLLVRRTCPRSGAASIRVTDGPRTIPRRWSSSFRTARR